MQKWIAYADFEVLKHYKEKKYGIDIKTRVGVGREGAIVIEVQRAEDNYV